MVTTPAAGATPRITLGIDLGTATTRVALLDVTKPLPTVVRNELSNEATSTVVSYPTADARCYGENAASKQITKAPETVTDLVPWLFGCATSAEVTSWDSAITSGAPAAATPCGVRRMIGGGELHPVQVAAYFIKSVLRFAPGEVGTYPVCLSIPTFATPEAVVALQQASRLAGILKENIWVAHSDEAMAAYFHHMQYHTLDDEKPMYVTILDVGQSCVSACVLAVTKGTIQKLAADSLPIGSGCIDAALCSYVYEVIEKKHGDLGLRGDIKTFRKVLRECRKAKEMLSTTEETKVMIEGIKGDIDVSVVITRAHVEQVSEPFLTKLEAVLQRLKVHIPTTEDGAEPRVEVIGGGWRAPYVADFVKRILGVSRLGVCLDANLSVSEGSAILAELCCPLESTEARHPIHDVELINFSATAPSSPISVEDELHVSVWADQEAKMSATDDAIHERHAAINRLDSYVLQTLDAVDRCGADSAQKDVARSYLLAVDEFTRDCDAASTAEIEAKFAEVKAHVESSYPEVEAHYEAVRAEEKRKEEELAKLAQMHNEDEGELKSDPQRLRMAQKRREQGQTLFKQDCWQEAQTRFVQALSILGQLYDTDNPENKAKKAEISLSCHLNIASCSVKLGLWRNAINNCTSALDLSPNNGKALFRRGQAYAAMKDYAEALQDLELASQVTNGDSAVSAELVRARQHLEAEKAKEKKMFSKMFS